jgi:hypothetical protein
MVHNIHKFNHNNNCAKAQWRKSSYSNGQANCVEVATNLPGMVVIRDSRDPQGPALAFAWAEWRAFVTDIQNGTMNVELTANC